MSVLLCGALGLTASAQPPLQRPPRVCGHRRQPRCLGRFYLLGFLHCSCFFARRLPCDWMLDMGCSAIKGLHLLAVTRRRLSLAQPGGVPSSTPIPDPGGLTLHILPPRPRLSVVSAQGDSCARSELPGQHAQCLQPEVWRQLPRVLCPVFRLLMAVGMPVPGTPVWLEVEKSGFAPSQADSVLVF